MNTLTLEMLERRAHAPADPPNRLSVGLDSGGIAAGGREILAALREEKEKAGLALEVRATGSLGLAFADPVVLVQREGHPPVTYGAVDEAFARRIVREHCLGGTLLEDHLNRRDETSGLRGRGGAGFPPG
jgi:NADP-reducing hydrogenase subunit HndB